MTPGVPSVMSTGCAGIPPEERPKGKVERNRTAPVKTSTCLQSLYTNKAAPIRSSARTCAALADLDFHFNNGFLQDPTIPHSLALCIFIALPAQVAFGDASARSPLNTPWADAGCVSSFARIRCAAKTLARDAINQIVCNVINTGDQSNRHAS